MNNEFKDYYKILGVTQNASDSNIKAARDRELSYFGISEIQEANIREAYNVLSNPETRREYDRLYEQLMDERTRALNNARTLEEFEAVQKKYPKPTPEVAKEETKKAEEFEQGKGAGTEGTGTDGTPEEEKEEEKTAGTGTESGTEGTGTDGTPEEQKEEEKTAGMGTESGTEGTGTEGTLEEEKEEEKTAGTGTESGTEGTGTEGTPEEEKEEEKTAEAKEETKKETDKANENVIPIEEVNPGFFARTAKKVWSKTNNSNGFKSVVAGAGIVIVAATTTGLPGLALSIPVALVTGKLINGTKKFKLKRDNKTKKITEFETEETKAFEKYNENLEKSINELLSKTNKNYELNIAILKYRNQVELLKDRIRNKKSQHVKRGGMSRYKIELRRLERQLERTERTLALLEEKVKGYDKSTRLTKLNEDLYEKRDEKVAAQDEISKKEKNKEKVDIKEKISVKNLEVDFNALKRKRDKKATRMAIHKEDIAKKQAFLVAFDVAKKKVSDLFGRMRGMEPKDVEDMSQNMEGQLPEEEFEEEKGGKTR